MPHVTVPAWQSNSQPERSKIDKKFKSKKNKFHLAAFKKIDIAFHNSGDRNSAAENGMLGTIAVVVTPLSYTFLSKSLIPHLMFPCSSV
jgi:hypothetical protein